MQAPAFIRNSDIRHSVFLSFLGGYVDTLGFIALFGLFTNHVTGNFVLIGRDLIEPKNSVLLKLLAFPMFIASVALARLLILFWERRQRAALRNSMVLQLVLLLCFMVSGELGAPFTDADAGYTLMVGMFGTAAMGVQNAGSRLLLPHLAPSTVMTGNVTQLVIDLVDVALGIGGEVTLKRCQKFFWPVAAFGSGALLGALAYSVAGFLALAIPCLLLLTLCVLASREFACKQVAESEAASR